MNGLTVTTRPATSPLTVAQAKAHLRILDDGAEDVLIQSLIDAATTHIERSAGVALVTRTLRFQIEGFPDPIRELPLPMPPLLGVLNVKYYDQAGVQQTLPGGDYWVDAARTPGWLVPASRWPRTQCRPGAVEVNYTAGFGSAADVPPDLLAVVKLLVGHLYENREATSTADLKAVPMAVDSLLLEYARPRI